MCWESEAVQSSVHTCCILHYDPLLITGGKCSFVLPCRGRRPDRRRARQRGPPKARCVASFNAGMCTGRHLLRRERMSCSTCSDSVVLNGVEVWQQVSRENVPFSCTVVTLNCMYDTLPVAVQRLSGVSNNVTYHVKFSLCVCVHFTGLYHFMNE